MKLDLAPELEKSEVFNNIGEHLRNNGFSIVKEDQTRPWGGFFVIDEAQSEKFIDFFFHHVRDSNKNDGKISPKILIVAKNKRLSWQYHHRRSELWKVIGGSVGVVKSDTDEETDAEVKNINDIIILRQGERHRLIGLDEWGIIAEIWQHTDKNNPSDEEDIIRIQDDFGR